MRGTDGVLMIFSPGRCCGGRGLMFFLPIIKHNEIVMWQFLFSFSVVRNRFVLPIILRVAWKEMFPINLCQNHYLKLYKKHAENSPKASENTIL